MREPRLRRRCRRYPFSLMEIMIVIVIIGMIAGLVGPALIKNLITAKEKAARAQVSLLKNACLDFYLDLQEYPNDLDDLITKSGDAKWDGPYLDPPKIPLDPWGQPYHYEKPSGGSRAIKVWSGGEDKVSGGDDDITSEN